MTGPEYRAILDQLGSTPYHARTFFEVDAGTSYRWARHGPPNPVARALIVFRRLGLTIAAAEAIANGRAPGEPAGRALFDFARRRLNAASSES